ncbi:MAG TPA: hypothetical protein VGE97_08740 [Nitrososphaera sp.]
MDRIQDMYTWNKYMRMRQRWGTRGVVQIQGAELVRAAPMKSVKPKSEEPKPEETTEAPGTS